MRKLFDQLTARLGAFIEQRHDVALVVRCGEPECAIILRLLRAQDEGGGPDLHWMFTEAFHGARDYVDRIVLRFQEQLARVNEVCAKQGQPPLPPVPAASLEARAAPVERLRTLMRFARSLHPDPEGQRLVWGLFPLELHQPMEYALFIAELLRHEYPVAWCHQMRIFLRDPRTAPVLHRHLQGYPRVGFLEPDLSPEALERSLEAEAADERQPLPTRLQTLLVLAGLDYSHRRYPEALAKYQLLLRYYQATGNPTLSALVLNGMGEVCQRVKNLTRAAALFESALTPAIEAKAYPVLLNITLNLANLKLEQEKWSAAESYYDSAAKLSTALRMPQVRIQCLENLGFCRYQQDDLGEAAKRWTEAAGLARSVEEPGLLVQVLQRLRGLFNQAGLRERRKAVEQELAALGPQPTARGQ